MIFRLSSRISAIFLNCFVKDINSYYSCCNCGHLFLDLDKNEQFVCQNEIEQFEKIADILQKRRKIKQISVPPHRYNREQNNPYFQQKIWSLWVSLYGKLPPIDKEIREMVLKYDRKIESTYGHRYVPSKIIEIAKEHEYCINRIGECGFWLRIGARITGVTICPYALAYIFFRLYWEGKDSAHGMKFWHDSPTRHKRYYDFNLFPHDVDISELEYIEMFNGCLDLATKSFYANEIRVPSPEEISTYSIYWEGFKPVAKTNGRISFFQPRGPYLIPKNESGEDHQKELESNLDIIKELFLGQFKT
ncbi:MAG TPA: hypothetical protein VJ546_00535 [Bacillales bacterium]|nr:hypothetical protein [Bacillales bacterium]